MLNSNFQNHEVAHEARSDADATGGYEWTCACIMRKKQANSPQKGSVHGRRLQELRAIHSGIRVGRPGHAISVVIRERSSSRSMSRMPKIRHGTSQVPGKGKIEVKAACVASTTVKISPIPIPDLPALFSIFLHLTGYPPFQANDRKHLESSC